MTKAKIATLRTLAIKVGFLTLIPTILAASNSVSSCGSAITSSGTWTLTQNLTCSGDGIDVQAGNVILKLNGFTITGPGTNGGTGVLVASSEGTSLNKVTVVALRIPPGHFDASPHLPCLCLLNPRENSAY